MAPLSPVATHGPQNKRKDKSFTVSWVEFLKNDDCAGFDDRETTRPAPSATAQNYLFVGQGLTNQAKARIRPSGATGDFTLAGAVNQFSVTPTTLTSTSDVVITVTATATASDNVPLNAIANRPNTIEEASTLQILLRRRIDRNIVQWKIIEDNDDVQAIREGQQTTPNASCITAGANGFVDTVKEPGNDDQYGTDGLTRSPVLNAGANGRCETKANDKDVASGTPNSASDLQSHINDVTWGRQANIFVNVNPAVLEKEVNFDLNRDGKLTDTRESRNEFDRILKAYNSGPGVNDPIDLYYIGMPYKPYTNPITGRTSTAGAIAALPGRYGIYGTQGIGLSVAAHELGHNFNAKHRQTLNPDGTLNPTDYVGYVMYPNTSGIGCRTGKEDWDDVQPPRR